MLLLLSGSPRTAMTELRFRGSDGIQAAVTVNVSAVPPGGGVVVSTVAAILAEVAKNTPLIIVTPGNYGALQFTGPHPGVTVRGQLATKFSSVKFAAGTTDLTLENVSVTGGTRFDAASDITIRRCDLTGGQTVELTATSGINRNIRVLESRLHHASTDLCYCWGCDGLLFEDCEFTGLFENGNHNDCTQLFPYQGNLIRNVVWRRNWVHDNAAQGFFAKDGVTHDLLVEDCLFARCAEPTAKIQTYDANGVTVRRCTAWGPGGLGLTFRGTGNKRIVADGNVLDSMWVENETSYRANLISQDYNVLGTSYWANTVRGTHDVKAATLLFEDQARDDWRLKAGQPNYGKAGVTWTPTTKTYGPR